MSIENIEKATHGTYYIGSRDERDTVVIRRAADQFRELDLRLDLAKHSPSGFNWRYGLVHKPTNFSSETLWGRRK